MAPSVLNFAVLGRREFEVYPFYVRADGILITSFLEVICWRWGVPHLQHDAHFWLVCYMATLNCRTK